MPPRSARCLRAQFTRQAWTRLRCPIFRPRLMLGEYPRRSRPSQAAESYLWIHSKSSPVCQPLIQSVFSKVSVLLAMNYSIILKRSFVEMPILNEVYAGNDLDVILCSAWRLTLRLLIQIHLATPWASMQIE